MSNDVVIPKLANLGDLANPELFHEKLTLGAHDRERLKFQLRQMLLIRYCEEELALHVEKGEVHCPCHLGIGQEAVAVGVSEHLRSSDRIFGGHRSHSHYLAVGGSLEGLFAETLGRVDGCSKGMGGSMHLFAGEQGFLGSVPIVAATVPLAVGAALAAQMDKNGDVAVAYLGDGAMEEGAVHEAMNFASIFKLPVLFVCENNLFSSHLHIDLRQPSDSVARFAHAHAMAYATVDGNDVIKTADAVKVLVERSREGQGPAFLEAITYRWRGHVGPREDLDVGVKRGPEYPLWRRRDPVRRLAEALIADGCYTEAEWRALEKEVREEVQATWIRAAASPYPEASQLLSIVYANSQSVPKAKVGSRIPDSNTVVGSRPASIQSNVPDDKPETMELQ